MTEGNGVDLASIYGLLLEVAKTVSRHDVMLERQGAQIALMAANLATKADLAALASATKAEFADLRQTIDLYHSSVVGHGILLTELDERVHRIEGHLDLPPMAHG